MPSKLGDMRLLLITGIPATGKTTVGDYLAEHHGFQHLDFEDIPTLARYVLQRREQGLREHVAAMKHRNANMVVTWGFVPRNQLQFVLVLRKLGFDWIWFDGDRDAAHRVFNQRGTVSEEAWQVQLHAIATYVDLDKLKPRLINPFDGSGTFRPLDDVATDVLGEEES